MTWQLFSDQLQKEKTGHAHGHLEHLEEVGDPATGESIGDTASTPCQWLVRPMSSRYASGMAKEARKRALTR